MCVVKYLFASQIAVCFIFTFRDLFMFWVSNLNRPLIEQLLSRGYVRCGLLSTQMLPAHPHHLSTSSNTNELVFETLKVVDPLYLVSMPGDVKKPHREMENLSLTHRANGLDLQSISCGVRWRGG